MEKEEIDEQPQLHQTDHIIDDFQFCNACVPLKEGDELIGHIFVEIFLFT